MAHKQIMHEYMLTNRCVWHDEAVLFLVYTEKYVRFEINTNTENANNILHLDHK